MTDRINKLRELFLRIDHKQYRIENLGLSILNEDKRFTHIRKALAFDCAPGNMPIFLQEGDLIGGGKTAHTLPRYITDEEIAWGNSTLETGDYFNMFDKASFIRSGRTWVWIE